MSSLYGLWTLGESKRKAQLLLPWLRMKNWAFLVLLAGCAEQTDPLSPTEPPLPTETVTREALPALWLLSQDSSIYRSTQSAARPIAQRPSAESQLTAFLPSPDGATLLTKWRSGRPAYEGSNEYVYAASRGTPAYYGGPNVTVGPVSEDTAQLVRWGGPEHPSGMVQIASGELIPFTNPVGEVPRRAFATWAPGGERLALMSLDPPLSADLYIVGPSGALEHLGAARRSQSKATRLAWSKDGRRLAVADETFRVFELDTGSTYAFEMRGVVDLRWSPDHTALWYQVQLEEGYEQGLLQLNDGRLVLRWSERASPTQAIGFSPSGDTLAIVEEGTLTLLDVRSLRARALPVLSLALSATLDLRWSASGEHLVIWGDGLAIASRNRVLLDMPGKTADARWSPDGRRVSYAGERGLELISVEGERRSLWSTAPSQLAWSPRGDWLIALGSGFVSAFAVDEALQVDYPKTAAWTRFSLIEQK